MIIPFIPGPLSCVRFTQGLGGRQTTNRAQPSRPAAVLRAPLYPHEPCPQWSPAAQGNMDPTFTVHPQIPSLLTLHGSLFSKGCGGRGPGREGEGGRERVPGQYLLLLPRKGI